MDVVDDPPSNPSASERYFCHSCANEVTNVQDFKCPSCSGGFIELLEDSSSSELPRTSDSSQPSPSSSLGRRRLRRRRHSIHHVREFPFSSPTATVVTPVSTAFNVGNLVRRPVITVQGVRNPPIHSEEFFRAIYTLNNQMTDPEFLMSGNIGDYAVGRNGIEAIVAQLFHQMDQSGPQPLSETTFESLPLIVFREYDYPECNQCSVCWERFEENEVVRQLPCSHIYHNNCIKPWLLSRCTCPICRMPVASTSSQPPSDHEPQPNYSYDEEE